MKKIALLLILALGATTLFAQQGPRRGGNQRMNPEQRAERMAKLLELNDEQTAEIKDFLENSATAMRDELEAVETREEKKAIMDDYRALTDEKMKSVLTEEQFAKYEEQKARRAERADRRKEDDRSSRRNRGSGDGGR